jgi:hypothetical protein
MPFADDYQTVGELYASIRDSVCQLVADLGEEAVFVFTKKLFSQVVQCVMN